jgi:hypothetical protein
MSSALLCLEALLPPDTAFGNLVALNPLLHTPLTYHRTWETGLGAG